MTELVVDPIAVPDSGDAAARPPAQTTGPLRRRRRHQRQAPSLPLDVVLAIAARTDAPTLVRFAATCADARRRLADDPNLRGRLRLRHAVDRFVPPLLRGDLFHERHTYPHRDSDMYLADFATTKLRRVTAAAGYPVTWRDGLLLLRMDKNHLRVCDPATGRSQAVPLPDPPPARSAQANEEYALLVGEDAASSAAAASTAGRPFQVLFAYIEVSKHRRYLQVQTFSPEHGGGAWSSRAEIRTPNLHGSRLIRGLGKAMVVGGAVHWLCLTDAGAYAVRLHVRAAQVTVTALPESVPHTQQRWWHGSPLMATSSPGGSLVVCSHSKLPRTYVEFCR
ncbi:hypothetical protein HU200_045753 [Digitaria exilis]|uniref:DUF7595 domain-containing protein n=1 Tax=Digitaria exilis TaxID=1010633 RepID=A0A835EA18_9POAL|nr:hypothetical protein HU200_045753 [Digitaria exilis]